MKICSKCKIEKEPYEFYKNKRNKDCLEYSCKLCNTCKKSSTYTKRMRDLIIKSFRNKGYTKTSKTQEILGCSFDDLKVYIESKFEPW